jgi:ADP-ribosylglycohydrolase
MVKINFCDIILEGIKKGDIIGGPYELAKILLKSLEKNKEFNENDLRNRYLDWWKGDAFDTGPTFSNVFNKIEKGMDPKVAVKKVHEEFGYNTAGCGPAHRATPLAGMFNIPTDQLITLAKKEAKITHYDVDAGNGSAIVIMLCRYLLEGKSFYDAKNLVCNDKDLKDSWIKLQKAEIKPDGYIYNVILSALHFIKEEKTLADAIKFSGKANYCPIIFSVIKKCMTINAHERM